MPELRVPPPVEPESIFTPPEESGDDLFGMVPPRVHLPIGPPLPSLEVEQPPAPPVEPLLVSAPLEPQPTPTGFRWGE